MRQAVIAGSLVLLAALLLASLFIGSGGFSPAEVWASLTGTQTNESTALIIRDFRIPRTIMGVLVGAALGTAGVLMQTSARNPLADPGLLGVNAGAYLAVVVGALWLGAGARTGGILLALVGAAAATLLVHLIGSRGVAGGTPAKLVLTGVALTAVFTGAASAISLLNPDIFDKIRHWNAGTLQGSTWSSVHVTTPFVVLGVLGALALTSQLNALLLGDDSARGLGVSARHTRIWSAAATTILCGAATAAAGPITFIGLMVPHALRSVLGPDLRWLLPGSLLAGPILVLAADVAGRLLVPGELPMGVVTALMGAPILVLLVRRRGVRA